MSKPNPSTPSTHESLMSGLFAGHEVVYSAVKKIVCCPPAATQDQEAVAAKKWQEHLDRAFEAFRRDPYGTGGAP